MTAENISGNLNRKVLLSFPFDPQRPDANQAILEDSPELDVTFILDDFPWTTNETWVATSNHYQDTISQYIMEKNLGRGAIAGKSADSNNDKRSTVNLTIANEFELDLNQLTHTFQTLTAVAPLPGMPKVTLKDPRKTEQLNALSIDLGMIREVISVQGILIDRVDHPSSASGHHLRRQHLLDMVRSQYGFLREMNRKDDNKWLNINKFPALTIGPVFDRTTGAFGDKYYTGDQPSDDVRGTEHSGASFPSQTVDATERGRAVNSSWNPSPSYKGRHRYRGLIQRASVRNEGGRPDVWIFNFEFVVVKNEMQQRMIG